MSEEVLNAYFKGQLTKDQAVQVMKANKKGKSKKFKVGSKDAE